MARLPCVRPTRAHLIEARLAEREAAANRALAHWQSSFVDSVDIEGTLSGAVYDYVRE
ncbi:hypothetical protein [Nocardia sp. NPDC059239]|uniref:hypothetical protein n=1 Tax=Nocardia sp. NPDC059239 TaxID=3346785 RepID=UPI0036C08CC1